MGIAWESTWGLRGNVGIGAGRVPIPDLGPMITSADPSQAQPDSSPRSGDEKLRALALLEQEGFTGSLVEVKAVEEVVSLPIPGGEGGQPIPRLDKLEQR